MVAWPHGGNTRLDFIPTTAEMEVPTYFQSVRQK